MPPDILEACLVELDDGFGFFDRHILTISPGQSYQKQNVQSWNPAPG